MTGLHPVAQEFTPMSTLLVPPPMASPAAPALARLSRLTPRAGRQATAVLTVLDEQARGRARQIAADEIFVGRQPVLMTIEQDSLCWLGGRLADRRDGDEWAKEFTNLP